MRREGLQLIIRQRRAVSRAIRVLNYLQALGVSAFVTGSLAEGRFGPESDVDFLVTSCPRHLKYRIEAGIEDIMLDMPFDTVYQDEAHGLLAERLAAASKDTTTLLRDAL